MLRKHARACARAPEGRASRLCRCGMLRHPTICAPVHAKRPHINTHDACACMSAGNGNIIPAHYMKLIGIRRVTVKHTVPEYASNENAVDAGMREVNKRVASPVWCGGKRASKEKSALWYVYADAERCNNTESMKRLRRVRHGEPRWREHTSTRCQISTRASSVTIQLHNNAV